MFQVQEMHSTLSIVREWCNICLTMILEGCTPGIPSAHPFQQFPVGRGTKGQHCWQGDRVVSVAQRAGLLNRDDNPHTIETERLVTAHTSKYTCTDIVLNVHTWYMVDSAYAHSELYILYLAWEKDWYNSLL